MKELAKIVSKNLIEMGADGFTIVIENDSIHVTKTVGLVAWILIVVPQAYSLVRRYDMNVIPLEPETVKCTGCIKEAIAYYTGAVMIGGK